MEAISEGNKNNIIFLLEFKVTGTKTEMRIFKLRFKESIKRRNPKI